MPLWPTALLALALTGHSAQGRPYEVVLGEDWRDYRDTPDLRARVPFFSFSKTQRAADYVHLVPDPTFGQVVRITQPVTSGYGFSPELRRRLPRPLDRVWFRWRMRYSPGWTTAGPTPPGHANAYKIAFITWSGVPGRAETVLTNTNKYNLGFYQARVPRTETRLTSSGWHGQATTAEWTGAEWWEFIMYVERLSPTRLRGRWWKRQLTEHRVIVDKPFEFDGWEQTATSGTFAPAGGISLGINKNKGTPAEQYIYWGPFDVVDGSAYPNPFNLPGVR